MYRYNLLAGSPSSKIFLSVIGEGIGSRISSNRGRSGWTPFFQEIRIESIPGEELI
jgi:hypothetical protein